MRNIIKSYFCIIVLLWLPLESTCNWCLFKSGIFRDPYSCAAYYDCRFIGGDRHVCPGDLHYNIDEQKCDEPETAGCIKNQKPSCSSPVESADGCISRDGCDVCLTADHPKCDSVDNLQKCSKSYTYSRRKQIASEAEDSFTLKHRATNSKKKVYVTSEDRVIIDITVKPSLNKIDNAPDSADFILRSTKMKLMETFAEATTCYKEKEKKEFIYYCDFEVELKPKICWTDEGLIEKYKIEFRLSTKDVRLMEFEEIYYLYVDHYCSENFGE